MALHLLFALLLFSNLSNFTNSSMVNPNASNTTNITTNTTTNQSNTSISAQPTVIGIFRGEFVGNFSVIPLGPRVSATQQIGALPTILNAVLGTQKTAFDVLVKYGYFSLFILMLLDSSALPPPSEFVMPPAGFLARIGLINFGLAFIVLLVANIIGITIDYFIAAKLGKEFVYRHARIFNIKRRDMKVFEKHFSKNESIIILVCRMIPGLRIIISFVSGFTKVPLNEYYISSIIGLMVYNYVLMVLGYFLISENSSLSLVTLTVIIPVLLFLIYKYGMKRLK